VTCPKGIVVEVENEEGDYDEVVLPTQYEVCGGCNGKGKHVNRNIDGNGLTREDFEEDPDFEEAYFRGDYDVVCEDCHGQRVEEVIDEERCGRDPKLKAALERHYAMLQSRADDARYQRMEAGDY